MALALAAALCIPAQAATSAVTPEMDREVRDGVDCIYRMEFEAAQGHFERLHALNAKHPFGDFGLTAVAWVRFVYGTEMSDESLIKPFDEQVKRTADTAKAWLAEHPDDAEAYMTLGAALGIQARLQATRRQYLRAYMSGRNSMKAVHAALKLDPNLYDASLGTGMYDYYTDLYPRMVRALTKFVLRGDRARGISQLKVVAEKGRWMSVTAKMILVEIFLHDPYGARDPAGAVKLMEDVRRRYPKSAMLHSAQLIALYQTGRVDDFHKGAAEFVRKASSGEYRKVDLPKGYVLLGTSFWAMKKPEDALGAFRHAAEERPSSRWAVWATIRVGHVLDLLGRREEALLAYKRAAGEPDRWGYKDFAEKGLSRPFRLDSDFSVDPP